MRLEGDRTVRKLMSALMAFAVTATLTLAPQPAEANKVWPIVGAPGGAGREEVTLRCPDGEALVGFGGTAAVLLNSVQIMCARLLSDRTFGAPHPEGNPVGATGGDFRDPVTCPRNARMQFLYITQGWYGSVEALHFNCMDGSGKISILAFGRLGPAPSAGSGPTPTPYWQSCPQEYFTGVGVAIAPNVKGVGAICEPLTPAAAPPPLRSTGKMPKPSGPPVASALALAGAWQTVTNQNGHFTVILQINNPSLDPLLYDLYVTGQMINTDGAAEYNGTLQGTIPRGTRTLQYTFVQPAISGAGTGQFTLSQDGNSISGTGKGGKEGDPEFTWNGTRAK